MSSISVVIADSGVRCISDEASKMPPCEGSIKLESAGGDESLVFDGSGPKLSIKGLTEGTNINLSDDGTEITISDSDATSLASAGGTSLVFDGVGPDLVIKGLTSSPGIAITDNGNDLELGQGPVPCEVSLITVGPRQIITLTDISGGVGAAIDLTTYGTFIDNTSTISGGSETNAMGAGLCTGQIKIIRYTMNPGGLVFSDIFPITLETGDTRLRFPTIVTTVGNDAVAILYWTGAAWRVIDGYNFTLIP